jgi:hypothetical protein
LKTISLSNVRRKGRAFISWRSSGREAGEKQPLEAKRDFLKKGKKKNRPVGGRALD